MKFKTNFLYMMLFLFAAQFSFAQQAWDRWQQRAEYQMEIDLDVKTNRYQGKQRLVYYNNSPETLNQVFYHLYFNAFQPESMMDIRTQTLGDPDKRVKGKIAVLKDEEIGYQKIRSLKQDGSPVKFEVVGTILEVQLAKPIPAGGKTVFEMDYEAQVPLQTRRSGRDNKEGIRYSMTQWYPKLCEYDYQGWHANPYVGREFYGIWGDFDVKITLDKDYIIGGTGMLQNANEIGYGYAADVDHSAKSKLTWHFVAKNVHDFAWAADPDYTHTTAQVPDGPLLHFFFQEGEKTNENWGKLPNYTVKTFQYINKHFGKYPYQQYSVIQGGDGGMEYPMCTLITGHRGLESLVGVTVHEVFHTWYQMLMGSNEALHAWMDEGFTSYGSNIVEAWLFEKEGNPHKGSYDGYFSLIRSGKEEPLSIHADHYDSNFAYGRGAYSKGAVFLHQLGYVIGQQNLDEGILDYYNKWKFKHPNPNDVIRIMEQQSGIELDWYKEYFVNSTQHIDYAIKGMEKDGKNTKVNLERIGGFPMPIDLFVEYTDGTYELFYIPLRIMRGEKPEEIKDLKRTIAEDWPWTHPKYSLTIPVKTKKIKTILIDPSLRLADVDIENNFLSKTE